MTRHLKIEFISDVVCPWCAIGLHSLEEALRRAADVVQADIRFQPFELNPDMGSGGENIDEYLATRYGSTPEQLARSREEIRQRAAEVGLTINQTAQSRIYNTFDAHRLLHWADTLGRQRELKQALLQANFADNENVADPAVLTKAAVAAGLDADAAREVLTSGRYTDEVRAAEQHWHAHDIRGVPAAVIDDEWVISGGQPVELFEQALRQIAAEDAP